jgi:hypothetical protein
MTGLLGSAVGASFNRSATYDLLLLAHVLAALVGLGATAASGVAAWRVRGPGSPPPAAARYFRPGPDVAGRTLYLVPVLGVVLVALSHGTWSFSDTWVEAGAALWAAAVGAGEAVLWPAEAALTRLVAEPAAPGTDRRSPALRVALASAAVIVLVVTAAVLMVGKP